MLRVNVSKVSVVALITILLITVCLAWAAGEPNKDDDISTQSPAPAGVVKQRPKIDVVTIADFYLRDGNAVSGKLLNEDKNQVVVELPEGSTVVVRSYTKKEVDTRTFATRPLAVWKYYTTLGDYFIARTWDFVDDPDDFIEAIRCYEKAKQSLLSQEGSSERMAEIDALIQKARQDREVWTSQVESRAKLKKLEYEAEAENRLKKLEKQIVESNVKLNESIKEIDKAAEAVRADYQRLEKTVIAMNKDFVEQIKRLEARLRDDEAVINDLQVRLFLVTRPVP